MIFCENTVKWQLLDLSKQASTLRCIKTLIQTLIVTETEYKKQGLMIKCQKWTFNWNKSQHHVPRWKAPRRWEAAPVGAPAQTAQPPLFSHWSHQSDRTLPSRCRPGPRCHYGGGGAPGPEAAVALPSEEVLGPCSDTGWTASRWHCAGSHTGRVG